jgi:hypothetical protein
MLCKLVQLLKHVEGIRVIPTGMTMLVMEVELNAEIPILVTPDGIRILVMGQPPNAPFPILVTSGGIVMLFKSRHPLNRAGLIVVRVDGSVMDVSLAHISNACCSMRVTVLGIIILVKLV